MKNLFFFLIWLAHNLLIDHSVSLRRFDNEKIRQDGKSCEGKREEKVHQGCKPFKDGLETKAVEDGKEAEKEQCWVGGDFCRPVQVSKNASGDNQRLSSPVYS